jgi:hypothetical protein
MLAGTRLILQHVQDFSDAEVLDAVQRIATRLDQFDRDGESLILKFNRELRSIQRYCEASAVPRRYEAVLPSELDL